MGDRQIIQVGPGYNHKCPDRMKAKLSQSFDWWERRKQCELGGR